ncbi:MAG: NAD-dependent epimerase/dehydratase family protein, partial [Pseudonocardiaceae bacterium]
TEPRAGRCEPVNICSGHPHTVGELAAELAHTMGGPEPRIIGGTRPGDVRHVTADSTRATELLGYRAQVFFAEGIARFATDPLREPVTMS